METKKLKIGNYVYGTKGSPSVQSLVRVDNVSDDGINYNDTDNTYQYTAAQLSEIPLTADIILLSDFTLSGNRYRNNKIGFVKLIKINGTWMWFGQESRMIPIRSLSELQNFYTEMTGNILVVDEEGLAAELSKLIALLQPEGLVASNITQITATVSWNAVTGANGYKYSMNAGVSWSELVESTHVDLTGLTHDMDYVIRVKAIGDGEVYSDSPESEEYSFTTAALIVLDTPVVTASLIEEQSIDISWEAIANADGYQYKTGDGEWSATQTELTATIGLLSASTEYTFYVKAIGDGVVYDNSLAGSLTETTLDEKLTMGSITSEALGATSVKFSWDEVANSVGYICQYKEGEGSFVDYVGEIADDEGVRSVTLTDLTPGTQYTFSVIADADTGYRDSDAAEGVVNTNAE